MPRAGCSPISPVSCTTLEDRGGGWVPLREELELAQQYLEVERNRFGDDLCVEFQAGDPAADWPVPAFLLQPLIATRIFDRKPSSAGTPSLGRA